MRKQSYVKRWAQGRGNDNGVERAFHLDLLPVKRTQVPPLRFARAAPNANESTALPFVIPSS